MKRAAVFFDRDNTLISNDGYLGDPRTVELVAGAADAVARARGLGYAVVVFSNQSGVARGMFTEEAVHAVNHRMDEMLLDENAHAVIDRHEFCPYHPEAVDERYRQDSDLRKPKPGMILQAERLLALDLSRSWVIGDAPRDIDAGKAAGCRAILVKDASLTESDAAREPGHSHPDYVVESLGEAMEVIARHPAAVDEVPAVELTPIPVPAPLPTPAEVVEEEAAVESIGSFVPVQPDVQHGEPPASETPVPVASPASVAAKAEADPEIPRSKSRSKSEILLGQILDELRRRNEHPADDFSVSKLMAGIVQVLALAALFYSYLTRDKPGTVAAMAIFTGIFLQLFTIALLIMGKQKQ